MFHSSVSAIYLLMQTVPQNKIATITQRTSQWITLPSRESASSAVHEIMHGRSRKLAVLIPCFRQILPLLKLPNYCLNYLMNSLASTNYYNTSSAMSSSLTLYDELKRWPSLIRRSSRSRHSGEKFNLSNYRDRCMK